jgi:hypothetical protein
VNVTVDWAVAEAADVVSVVLVGMAVTVWVRAALWLVA